MKVCEEELLARLRALGGRARREPAAAEDAQGLLGLAEDELTPGVRSALHRLLAELIELRTELVGAQTRLAELERLADEDALAPISNRRAFLRQLERTISYVERYGAASSLLYFDLNGLKSINDHHGHASGDAALVHVAEVLLANTRNSDVIGRLGGDEFGVILVRAEEAAAAQKARSLADLVAATAFTFDGRTIPISVAYGAHGLLPGEDPQGALAMADRAMYEQKRARAGQSRERLRR